MMTNIYSLNCPITGKVKYVGKTKKSLKQRLLGHLQTPTSKVMLNYISELKKVNLIPEIKLIESVLEKDGDSTELFYTKKFSSTALNVVYKDKPKELITIYIDSLLKKEIKGRAKRERKPISYIVNEMFKMVLKIK